MKKQVILSASVFIAAGAIWMTGCKKEDTTPPVITITGGNSQQHILNASWTNPTATATDDEDGDLTASITVSGTVNKDLAGVYTLTYSVSDAAGNTAQETLTVTVYNEAQSWAGTYPKANIIDSLWGDAAHTNFVMVYTWQNDMVITASSTVNKRIIFNRFGDYSGYTTSNMIYGDVVGTTITIPNQTANVGNPAENHTFQGTGSIISTNPFIIKITYSDQASSGNAYGNVYFRK